MNRREEIEAALSAWRAADRRLEASTNGDRDAIQAEVERHRSEFQRLSADHMVEQIDALQEAEERRRNATPSTRPFHEAARDELDIAAEIWEGARQSDKDTPQHGN